MVSQHLISQLLIDRFRRDVGNGWGRGYRPRDQGHHGPPGGLRHPSGHVPPPLASDSLLK